MKKVIEFRGVSKKYRLGLTRTSLPDLISGWLRGALKPNSRKQPRDEFIWAVKDINFDLHQGESLALVGPNGAGKTTILKLLANITKPTDGQIRVNGRLAALIELGAGFHPDLTGRENIYLNGTILGLSRGDIQRRFDEIVAFSELEQFIDTPIKRYSSGMTVRLGFSVAASIMPDVLLVDEVLAVGDSMFRQKCLNRIKELLVNGTSVIFVSHSLWLIQAVCKHALYIDHGCVQTHGETSQVLEAYDKSIQAQRAARLQEAHSEQYQDGTEVEITKVEVIGRDNNDSESLSNKEATEIRIHYTAYRSIEVIHAVVRILRSDGLTCCMMRTSLDNYVMSVKRGKGVISVVLDPLQLYGGSYYAQVTIKDVSGSWTIASGSSEWFYVSGSPLSHQEMNGVFEPMRTWRHHQTAAEMNGKLSHGR